MKLSFFTFEQYIKSWSTWVLAGVTVTPLLDSHMQAVADLLPENLKPYFITTLGILGLIVRAIKQR